MADGNAKQAQDKKTEGLLWYSQTEKPLQAEGFDFLRLGNIRPPTKESDVLILISGNIKRVESGVVTSRFGDEAAFTPNSA